MRRPLQRHDDLRRRLVEALAGAQVERHAGPAPRVDVQAQRRVRLDVRVRRDAGLVAVAAILAAHEIGRRGRSNGFEDFTFSSRSDVRVGSDGRLHREMRDDLQQVVLDDVANRADFLVEFAAAADTEGLGHRHLHVVHVVAVPDRLEERVREAEEQQVLHRLLAEVVIDAIDGALVEAGCSASLSSSAEARSRPNGFSTTTLAPSAQPDSRSLSATVANKLGGSAK